MNYSTMMNCYESLRVSRQMRQALAEFRDAGDEPGDDAAGMESESLERRVAALEADNRGLRELVEGQARQLEELVRRVAEMEGTKQQADET